MVVIKLVGGLGNQMFQLAFASILAKKNNSSLLIDKNIFDDKVKVLGYTPRNYELHIFNDNINEVSYLDVQYFHKLSLIDKIKRDLGFNYPKICSESTFSYKEENLSIKAPVYLKGYFQSYRYLAGYEKLVNSIFKFPSFESDCVNQKTLTSIKKMKTISIHIRRGDYANDKSTNEFHGLCSINYYKAAIDYLVKGGKNFLLVFFSDDQNWVKAQFREINHPTLFVSNNDGKNAWKDMKLMSSCTHNIIANSSFSWWGAWLNENPNKIVLAPKQWFAKPEINTNDLIPREWIRL